MKKLLLIIVLYVTLITTLLILANLYIKPDYLQNSFLISITISNLIVFFIASKINLLKFERLSIEYKQLFISILLGSLLYVFQFLYSSFFKNSASTYEYSHYHILNLIIIAPIIEEVFFKKIILTNLRNLKLNKFSTIIITTTLFALTHFPSIHLIHLIVGLVTSFLYYTNKNLAQVIIIHAVYNLLNIFLP